MSPGRTVSWTGDLADELAELPTKRRIPLPGNVFPARPGTSIRAESAVARRSAHSHSPITQQLLADVLDGLYEL
jgi:hypothetical protein